MLLTAAFILSFGPYHAAPINVIDGDTITMDVSVWPGITQRVSVRVLGVDTPELRGKECERDAALKAKLFAASFVANGRVVVNKIQHDKFAGRVDADVSVNGVNLADSLIAAGLGVKYDGGLRKAWCE